MQTESNYLLFRHIRNTQSTMRYIQVGLIYYYDSHR